jgi:hypothetical protein
MRQSGASSANYCGKFLVCSVRPCRVDREVQTVSRRGVVDIIVEAFERDDFDSILLEQRSLVTKHRILSAGRARTVIIVRKKDSHAAESIHSNAVIASTVGLSAAWLRPNNGS